MTKIVDIVKFLCSSEIIVKVYQMHAVNAEGAPVN